jgi:predicted transcriptional regulator
MDSFKKKIRERMDFFGINQRELAEISGIDESKISKFLNDKADLCYKSFKKVTDALLLCLEDRTSSKKISD